MYMVISPQKNMRLPTLLQFVKMNVIFVDKELQINMLSLEFVVYLFQNMKHVSINNMAFLKVHMTRNFLLAYSKELSK